MSKRGHSNIIAEEVGPWHEVDDTVDSDVARCPIRGGSSPGSCRELPPLAIRREEWEVIGRAMGWTLAPAPSRLSLEMELRDAYVGQGGNVGRLTFLQWCREMRDNPRGTLRDAARDYLAGRGKRRMSRAEVIQETFDRR